MLSLPSRLETRHCCISVDRFPVDLAPDPVVLGWDVTQSIRVSILREKMEDAPGPAGVSVVAPALSLVGSGLLVLCPDVRPWMLYPTQPCR